MSSLRLSSPSNDIKPLVIGGGLYGIIRPKTRIYSWASGQLWMAGSAKAWGSVLGHSSSSQGFLITGLEKWFVFLDA